MSLILYYAPITCATSAHIILEESRLSYCTDYIDLKDGRHLKTNYLDKNPKGSVPALLLENGDLLTENQAILTYLADRAAPLNLIPPTNTELRARAHEWMNFCATGIHPYVRAVFRPNAYAGDSLAAQDAVRETSKQTMRKVCRLVEDKLPSLDATYESSPSWALGEHFSVCDAYLYIMYLWSRDKRMGELPLAPKWHQLARQVHNRPSTQRILKRELNHRPDFQFPAGFSS